MKTKLSVVLSTICCVFATLLSLIVNAQHNYWMLPPNKVDVQGTSFTNTAIPGAMSTTYSHGNCAYDENGNLYFYVQGNGSIGQLQVLSPTGVVVEVLDGGGGTPDFFCSDLEIVPVPGDCKLFYIIYSIPDQFAGTLLFYTIIDCSGATPVVSTPETQLIIPGFTFTENQIGLAVSRLFASPFDGRYLFVHYSYSIDRWDITNTGIINPISIFNASMLPLPQFQNEFSIHTHELDLYDSGANKILAWGSEDLNTLRLNSSYLVTSGIADFHKYPESNIVGVEITSPTRVYSCSPNGIRYYAIGSNAATTVTSAYTNTELEMPRNLKLMCVSNTGQLDYIDNPNTAPAVVATIYSPLLLSNGYSNWTTVYKLPDQVEYGLDEYDYFQAFPETTANAGPDVDICPDGSAILTGSGNGVLSWWDDDGNLLCNNCISVSVSPLATTTYTLVVTSILGCPNAQDEVIVNVLSNPVINLGPDLELCIGDPVSDIVVSPCNPLWTYSWSYPGFCLESTCNVSPCNNGTYCIEVIDENGCAGEDCVNVSYVECPEGKPGCFYIPSPNVIDYASETILGPDGKLITIAQAANPGNQNNIDIHMVAHDQAMNDQFHILFGNDGPDKYVEKNTSICTDGEFYYNLGIVEDGNGDAIMVVKTALDGTPVWGNGTPGNMGYVYGLQDNVRDIGYKVIDMTGSEFILIVGETNRYLNADNDPFALKLRKSDGTVAAYNVYYTTFPDPQSDDRAYDVRELQTTIPAFALAGDSRLTNGDRNALALIIDNNLNLITNFATIGMTNQNEVFYGVEQFGTDLYFSGAHQQVGQDWDGFIAKVPLVLSGLAPSEMHIYDGVPFGVMNARNDYFGDLSRDGNLLVVSGRTEDLGPGGTHDALIVFLDPNLNAAFPQLPVRTNKDNMHDAFFDVCVLPDQYIFTGVINPTGTDDEAYIVSTDKTGMNDCCTIIYNMLHSTVEKHSDKTLVSKELGISQNDYVNKYIGYERENLCDSCCVKDFNVVSIDQCTVCVQLSGNCAIFESYIIDWGDGQSDTGPCHDYIASGSYTITLFDDCTGEMIAVAEHAVDVNCPCDKPCYVVANWNFQLINNCTFALVDNSTMGNGTTPVSYTWTLDGLGGIIPSGISTVVTIPPGTHEVCLTVIGEDAEGKKCSDTFCQKITCCESQPGECGGSVLFNSTALSPCVYQFNDLTLPYPGSTITSWNWNFGDGFTSTSQNPLHAYSGTGPYTVTLVVQFAFGDTKCEASYNLILNPHCGQNCDIDITDLGLAINDMCQLITNPVVSYSGSCTINYWWDFGDGTTSTLPNPVHQYTSSGTFDVCLTVWVNCNGQMCSAQECKTGIEMNCPCNCYGIPQFNVTQIADCQVQLDYLGNLDPCLQLTAIKWVMGNGAIIYGNNLTYNYPAAGNYQICLLITATNGVSECILMDCQWISVNCTNGFASANENGMSESIACCEPYEFSYSITGCTVCVTPIGICTPFNDYFFDWGDGSPVGDGPCHNYASSGSYSISLYDNCSFPTPHMIKQHTVNVECPCDLGCLVTSRWTFTENGNCEFILTDMSDAAANSTITCYEWFLNGVLFATTANSTITITGTQAVCLHICGISNEGESCDSWYCQNLTCCEDAPCLIHSADFSWNTGNSCLDGYFTATVLPTGDISNYCGTWTIDGISIYPFTSFTFPHTFLTEGTHTVCLDIWCCDNPEIVIHICHDVIISCPCDLDDLSFTWTPNEEDCSSGIFEVSISPIGAEEDYCGSWNINGIILPFSGFTLPYDFLPGGPWIACLSLHCCDDPTGQTLITYCDTIVTCPCCQPIGFTYVACENDVDLCMTPVWPTPCVNPGTVLYDYGDGTGLTSDDCHDYTSNGTYVVCMYLQCWVMIPVLIECDTIVIDCDNSLCMTMDNPGNATRPRSDRGSSIASTPDGGFIVVGTVNEQYDYCTPITTYFTQACANDESDIYVAKYDADMNLEFDLRFGETGASPSTYYHETGTGVLVREDGYYILGDVLIFDNGTSTPSFDNDIIAFKVNLDGTLGWHERIGAKPAGSNLRSREFSAAIVDMKIEGGEDAILVAGSTNRFAATGQPGNNGNNYDFLAAKINPANGSIIDRRAYWNGSNDVATNNIAERARDAVRMETATTPIYGIAGEIFFSGNTERRVFVISIHQDLSLANSFVLNNPGTYERAWAIEEFNNNFYVGGSVSTTDGINTDLFLLKLNATLTMTNQNRFSLGASSHEYLRDLRAMNDGKLLAIFQNGSTPSPGGIESDGYVMTIDPSSLAASNVKSTSRPGYDERYVAISENYFITGYWDYNAYSTNLYNKERELYISRINTDDNNSCCTDPITLTTGSVSGTSDGAGIRTPVLEILVHGFVDGDYVLTYICPEEMMMRSATMQSEEEVAQLKMEMKVLIKPNPNDGKFILSTTDDSLIEKVDVMDLSGKVIYTYRCQNCVSNLTIDLTGLSQGAYIVQTTSGSGRWTNRMLVAR